MDGYEELGVEATEVEPEPVGRDIAIGVGGILVVIAAIIPVAAIAVTMIAFTVSVTSSLLATGTISFGE